MSGLIIIGCALFLLGLCVIFILVVDFLGRLWEAREQRRLNRRLLLVLEKQGPCPMKEALSRAGIQTRFVYRGHEVRDVDYELAAKGLIAYRYDWRLYKQVVVITPAGRAWLAEHPE